MNGQSETNEILEFPRYPVNINYNDLVTEFRDIVFLPHRDLYAMSAIIKRPGEIVRFSITSLDYEVSWTVDIQQNDANDVIVTIRSKENFKYVGPFRRLYLRCLSQIKTSIKRVLNKIQKNAILAQSLVLRSKTNKFLGLPETIVGSFLGFGRLNARR